jgi:ATP-dependent Zn protease
MENKIQKHELIQKLNQNFSKIFEECSIEETDFNKIEKNIEIHFIILEEIEKKINEYKNSNKFVFFYLIKKKKKKLERLKEELLEKENLLKKHKDILLNNQNKINKILK